MAIDKTRNINDNDFYLYIYKIHSTVKLLYSYRTLKAALLPSCGICGNRFYFVIPLVLLCSFLIVSCDAPLHDGSDSIDRVVPEELVVYSARKEHLIGTLFDRYTAETGTEIKLLTDKAGALLQRMQAEGQQSPADLFITVDAGNLWLAAGKNLLLPMRSSVLSDNIPRHFRDQKHRWYGLSQRARTIVYHVDRVDPRQLQSYMELADPRWHGRLCLRSGTKVYNRSLVASLLHHHGEKKVLKALRGWVANLAVHPFGSDTQALEAIISGRCDVTVVNTYYFGRLQRSYAGAGKKMPLRIHWPDGRFGVHVNISGAAIAQHSKHPQAALRLLEWLSTREAQEIFARSNLEFPVNNKAAIDPIVKSWSEFHPDQIKMSVLGELQPAAAKLIDRAGYR